ncbi:MAG: glycosyltransferase [Synechococcales bacterium]|nr:glycosyltransferase [Synechococcales bacterium]
MKVLHLIPSLSPLRGGPSQAILEMVQAQRQQGVEAVIATTNDHGDQTFLAPHGHCIESGSIPELAGPSVPIWVFPRKLSSPVALREFAIAPTLAPWLWRHLTAFDLVHVHAIFNYPTTLGMAIAQAKGIPYILRPLGSLGRWSLTQGCAKKQIYLRAGGRWLIQNSAALHFTSEQEQQEAGEAGFDAASFVLPHGVVVPVAIADARSWLRRWLRIPDYHQVLLFLSRLHAKKGIEHLIDALEILADVPLTLVIAGSGEPDYVSQITRRIHQRCLESRVRQVGFVSGDMKHRLLQGSDLFVLPSYAENLGIALLEAMAAGLPVITTPEVAIAPFIQQHRAGVITSPQPADLAIAIRHYWQHPEVAQQDGARGRAWMQQRYSWSTQAQQLIGHYDRLLGKCLQGKRLPDSAVSKFGWGHIAGGK